MPMNLMFSKRKVKLRKSSSEVISLCARIRSTDNSFLDICNKYYIHCEMTGDTVSQNFTSYLYHMLKGESKLRSILYLASMYN